VDWINTPNSTVIDFGPGISLSDITIQMGSTTSFGGPLEFSVSVKGEEGMLFEFAGIDNAANRTGGPPVLPISFRFADGETIGLTPLLATNQLGAMGTQFRQRYRRRRRPSGRQLDRRFDLRSGRQR
jgi:hypothetical protein